MIENCTSNQQCQNSLGLGACCLYEETSTSKQFNCRGKEWVDFYYAEDDYDQKTKTWTNPFDKSDTLIVYCKPSPIQSTEFAYPYPQPFLEDDQVRFDPVNKEIRSDMFYQPAKVKNWNDQWDKWITGSLLFWTPVPFMIWFNNWWYYIIDWITYANDQSKQALRPSMYNNWFTGLFMADPSKISGAFKWYDMFSVQGFDNWFWDSISFILIPWWEVIEADQRAKANDWTLNTVELMNYVDRNRFYDMTTEIDPYDYNYWSTRPDGVDCNGNVGYGYYCYCPSQGYNCQCKPNTWDVSGKKRDMCYDHYGYDCQGNLVDGEVNWC